MAGQPRYGKVFAKQSHSFSQILFVKNRTQINNSRNNRIEVSKLVMTLDDCLAKIFSPSRPENLNPFVARTLESGSPRAFPAH
jgi:hypothetical protein